eukprot:scaffold39996_cov57-Phaeocystis_antarctica.AAC.5
MGVDAVEELGQRRAVELADYHHASKLVPARAVGLHTRTPPRHRATAGRRRHSADKVKLIKQTSQEEARGAMRLR